MIAITSQFLDFLKFGESFETDKSVAATDFVRFDFFDIKPLLERYGIEKENI